MLSLAAVQHNGYFLFFEKLTNLVSQRSPVTKLRPASQFWLTSNPRKILKNIKGH